MKGKELGTLGENMAAEYLSKNGYEILTKNFRGRVGEIDIIGMKENILIFFEVKTRRNLNCGEPIESINAEKLRRIQILGEEYKNLHNLRNRQSRVDVIEILITQQQDI